MLEDGVRVGPRIRLSPLDSQRFGFSVARVEDVAANDVAGVTRRCLKGGVEMVVARCRAEDFGAVHAFERAGYLLMETLVDYLGPIDAAPASPDVRPGNGGDADAVAEVARVAFASYAGHYHADPRLAQSDCVEAYVSWARRCAAGEAAEDLVVAEISGRVVGFQAHCSPSPGTGQLLLVCVSPEARGRGLYHALGAYAQRWSSQQGHSRLLAVCHQTNYASHRVFIGLGLRPHRVTNTFHGWADALREADRA